MSERQQTLVDRIFGAEVVVPLDLEQWLADNGHGQVDPAALMDFAGGPCGGCGGEDGRIGEVIAVWANGTCGCGSEDCGQLWVWCLECLHHKESCAECGPVQVDAVFYLPFRVPDGVKMAVAA